jgi:hypothetical protein
MARYLNGRLSRGAFVCENVEVGRILRVMFIRVRVNVNEIQRGEGL